MVSKIFIWAHLTKKIVNVFPYCHQYLILYLACSLVVANFEARISTYGLQLSAGNFIVVWVELNPEGQLSAWNWEKALLQVFCSYLPNYCPHCPKLKMNGKKLSKNPVYIVLLSAHYYLLQTVLSLFAAVLIPIMLPQNTWFTTAPLSAFTAPRIKVRVSITKMKQTKIVLRNIYYSPQSKNIFKG